MKLNWDSYLLPEVKLTTERAEFVDLGVEGYTNDGCSAIDSVHVIVTNSATLFVPTAFSPNGDNLKDEVRVFLSGYTLNYFKIYNRRGQEMFKTTNELNTWNGTFKGQPMGMDSYYWVASVINTAGKTEILKGDIILVR